MIDIKKCILLQKTVLLIGLLLGSAAFPGCVTIDSFGERALVPIRVDKELARVKSRALSAYPVALWSANNYVVNVCFVDPEFAEAKRKIRDFVDKSWGRNSGLNIVWPVNIDRDLCPQTPPDSGNVDASYLPISLHAGTDSGDWGGVCQPGYGGRMDAAFCSPNSNVSCQCTISTADKTPDPAAYLGAVTIHEIGHALGLPHEHQRIDRPSDIASTCVDSNPDLDKWTKNGNYLQIVDLTLLTRYDGTASIMSYCRDWDQNGIADSPPYVELGNMDRLGIEIMYPKNYVRRAVPSGFGDALGLRYIVRSDSATSLNVDWVVFGALSTAFQSVEWRDSDWTVFSRSASTSQQFSSTSTVYVRVVDAFGRSHAWSSAHIVPDNTLHTAILMSIISHN